MVLEETLEKLKSMKLYGMVTAMEEQRNQPEITALNLEDRFGLLVDQQWTYKENRRLKHRLGRARLKITDAAVEKIDYQLPRNLNKSLLLSVTTSDWIAKKHNVIITGPTGCGKKLPCLRTGTKSLPGRLYSLVQKGAQAL